MSSALAQPFTTLQNREQQ